MAVIGGWWVAYYPRLKRGDALHNAYRVWNATYVDCDAGYMSFPEQFYEHKTDVPSMRRELPIWPDLNR